MRTPEAKQAYFIASYLEISNDLRGVPQVIVQLIRLLRDDPRLNEIRFVASRRIAPILQDDLKIPSHRIEWVEPLPWPFRHSFFYGMFGNLRYRRLLKKAFFIIHPEVHTVLRTSIPQAVLYHDFMYLQKAKFFSKQRWVRRLLLRHKFNVAFKTPYQITTSDHVKSEALRIKPGLSPSRLTVLNLGVRRSLMSLRQAPRSSAAPVFLYVGSVEERKNIFALIENLDRIGFGAGAILHLAGKLSKKERARLEDAVRFRNTEGIVEIHGSVSDEKLEELYSQASFLLFPSLQEGFGVPLVEAFSHGLAVFAFNNSTMAEIGADAVILADNNDFQSWGRAIGFLLGNPDAYREVSSRGLKRAEHFTEEAMFKRYGDYFVSILKTLSIS